MEYIYAATEEMDIALTYEADKQGKTAEELFNIIVTADMGTLVRNVGDIKIKTITPEQQVLMEKIESLPEDEKAKVEADVKPVSVEDITPVK